MSTMISLRVGQTVTYCTHTKDHKGWVGRIAAVETYTDDHGTRTWYYVRWMQPEGRIESEPMKCSRQELQA